LKKRDEFLKLQSHWYELLRQQGFKDIEDKKGRLKQKDKRTIAYQNKDSIEAFFTELGFYLSEHLEIPKLDREILELYAQGIYIIHIADEVNKSRWKVIQVIKKYKKIILNV